MSDSPLSEISLSDKQSRMLRQITQQPTPARASDLDGRTLGALERHGFVSEAGGEVVVTERGREFFNTCLRQRRRVAGRASGPEEARAGIVLQAVELLERALSPDRAMEVGDMTISGAELIAGLKGFASDLRSASLPATS